uniref:Uncharacterized protein n=1 Tax=Anguilla anguilla TaxID=7936 RepID=A0A0E9PKK4_ANGAN
MYFASLNWDFLLPTRYPSFINYASGK